MMRYENQKGYTLLEAIAVMAIISIVASTIVATMGRMYDRYKTSRLTSQIVELQKAIDQRFASAESYRDLGNKLIKDENLAPGDIDFETQALTEDEIEEGVQPNVSMRHKYGGTISVTTSGANPLEYQITFTNVPQIPCVELAMQDWEKNQSSDLIYMTVNNTRLEWIGENQDNIMPISVVRARNLCDSEKENTLTWVFQ